MDLKYFLYVLLYSIYIFQFTICSAGTPSCLRKGNKNCISSNFYMHDNVEHSRKNFIEGNDQTKNPLWLGFFFSCYNTVHDFD